MLIDIDIANKTKKILKAQDVADIGYSLLNAEKDGDELKEHAWVVGVDTLNRILYIELVSLGVLNKSLVCPREVFRMAISKSVYGIFLMHNHPSGEASPSEEDIKLTENLYKAGEILGIPLIDHIIIGSRGHCVYYSFKGDNMLEIKEE